MRYAGLKKNDATNCLSGICTSLWVQGCPHRCPGCHNPETWDKDDGMEVPANIKEQIIEAISANGIQRSFSVLGGEPLAEWNRKWVLDIIKTVREVYPDIIIYLWSGWTYEQIFKTKNYDFYSDAVQILNNINFFIDGKFEIEHRNITLALRGSRNQRIWERNPKTNSWYDVSEKYD
jgi:anaerobic ribonucleoside-triphosphate reductase activating protein